MVYHGTVQNGVIVFPNQPPLPEGTRVRVEPIESAHSNAGTNGQRSIWDSLEELAGTISDLPADFAANHDAYRRKRLGQ